MTVKMLTGMAGNNFSVAPGEEATLDKEHEKRLIDSGQAVKVTAKKVKSVKSNNSTNE